MVRIIFIAAKREFMLPCARQFKIYEWTQLKATFPAHLGAVRCTTKGGGIVLPFPLAGREREQFSVFGGAIFGESE